MGPANGERFTPDVLAADRAEAARLSRYRWAAGCLPADRVLDAGCGAALGTVELRRTPTGGVRPVVGIDNSATVVDATRAALPSGVTLEQADVGHLPYDSGAFAGAVCFDVLEHLEKPALALDELRRVLRPGGVLAVAVGGGIEREVLRDLLRDRFAHVRLFMQHEWVAAAVLEWGVAPCGDVSGPAAATQAGRTLALASDALLPEPPVEVVLGPVVDIDRWAELWSEQDAAIRSQLDQISLLERRNADVQALNRRLLDAEQRVAQVAQQREALARLTDEHTALERSHEQLQLAYSVLEEARLDLARELEAARAHTTSAVREAEADRARLDQMQSSTSWRMTKPLRWISGRFRRRPRD